MRCAACTASLSRDDQFCTTCGHPVPAAPVNAAPPVDRTTRLLAPPDPYAAEISRRSPAVIVLLVDRSGSMEEPIAGGGGQTKKQVVADSINRILYNAVLRCTKEDGVRPYFDIGVWTYGGNGEVTRAFDEDLVSIAQIPERTRRVETRLRKVPAGNGQITEQEMQFPIWFETQAGGNTPLAAAYQAAVGPLSAWVKRYPASFPPIVLNLTDGAYTGTNPSRAVQDLMDVRTSDGRTLVFNCHISKNPNPCVAFPAEVQGFALSGLARELFGFSSPLPDRFRTLINAQGYSAPRGARGFAFNADQVTLAEFLDIGTRVVQPRTPGI